MRGERIDIKGEATMSEEPPFYAVNLKILLKKKEKIYTRGETIPKPSKQERKERKTTY